MRSRNTSISVFNSKTKSVDKIAINMDSKRNSNLSVYRGWSDAYATDK